MKTTNRSLEGLRGAAALLVVFFHIGLLSPFSAIIRNGYLAVDLFFVLSGFVICSAYADRLETGHDVWRFIVRRSGRLWPLHIVSAILVCALLGMIFALGGRRPHVPTGGETIAIVTMMQGLVFPDRDIGNLVAWSTGDEFYVYLLFAVICLRLRRWRRVTFAAAAAAGFSIAVYVDAGTCVSIHHCMDLHSSFGWARCLAGFFVGALLAHSRIHLSSISTPAVQIAMATASLAFVAGTSEFPLAAFASPVVFAALIASLITDSGPLAIILQTRPMQYLGKISYALYLGHGVVVLPFAGWLNQSKYATGYQLTAIAVLLSVSFALAHLLHRYIEVPCRDRIYAWSDSRVDHEMAMLPGDRPEDRGPHPDKSTG
ncbi:acyltransferase family protein [Paraburkholderia silviterrae]|uniref:Acyltransferase n=1 Tax=Paraburkholderia silviterrae TaxID=2528715 RepID=A0A4R5LY64_9BURK|nr:acyltransferase [Paraburkholderia silviterrae]TDG17250.1 acyltransferase [Paraburkholderia silviterrae]